MEIPHIFDEFFNETSVWFLIFMLTSFLIGYVTSWWIYRITLRGLKKQIRQLKAEIIEMQLLKEPSAEEKETDKQHPSSH